ncbi:hypothetical protein [Kalamiella sp. sgz302252]|uniref:hypothetical protein n=1 Tax=Pantoea sp. sgz302252 TaxID=3341827 RepID=UPI0036D43C75
MKTRLVMLLLTLLLGVGTAYSATQQEVDQRLDFLFGSHQQYHDFLTDLQKAVAAKDKAKVAAMASYPLKVGLKGKEKTFRNPAALKKGYDSVFTPELSKIILEQKYEDLFARDRGVMVGDSGQLWFSGVCADKACKKSRVLIIRINQ